MKRNLLRMGIMLAVVAVAIISVGAIIRARSAKSDKVQIKTAKVERADVKSTVSATGIIQTFKTVDVKSNVGGTIEKLAVDIGDRVKKGQLIAKIDPTDTKSARDQAKAKLDGDKAKLDQALQNVQLQREQSDSQIAQAKEQLLSAQAKLSEAANTAKTQPGLTQAAIESAQADYNAAQEALKQLVDATIPQAKTSSLSTLNQSKSNLDTAKKNLDRQKQLLDKGFVPASTVDTADSQYETAKATYEMAQQKQDTVDQQYAATQDQARAQVARAKAQLLSAQRNAIQDQLKKDQLAAARAAVDEAKASLRLAQSNRRQIDVKEQDVLQAKDNIVSSQAAFDQAAKNLTYVTIGAPRDGIVLSKSAEEGTVIASSKGSVGGSGQAIVTIGDTSTMNVLCQVDETDVGSVDVGQTVDITVDAYPNEIFEGKVTRLDPQAKVVQNVTTIPVTVKIENPDARLKPDMNANCEFITAKHTDVLSVPNEAIKDDNGQTTVQVVLHGGNRATRNVEIGIQGSDLTEIKSGLKEGDTVVTQIIEPVTTTATTPTTSPFASPFGGMRPGGGRPGGGGGGGGRGR